VSAERQRARPRQAQGHFKDEILANLATHANIAQFVSFSAGASPTLRFASIHKTTERTSTVAEAVKALLSHAAEGSVNIRAFDPRQPKSHEFLYGLTDARTVVEHIQRLAASGLHSIVNETIDVGDGGVSGVSYGGVIEFAPEDTPRCVEKAGTASLPRELGLRVLEIVYGFRPELDQPEQVRVEFSIHPIRRGVRNTHTILWEEEEAPPTRLEADLMWPNRFSRFLGDKAFGLVVAHAAGLPVPETTVIPRNLPPFRFGTPTETTETWIRTCPKEPVPGLFTTNHGWIDPYKLLAEEDPTGEMISSVLAQEGIEAEFSGAAATDNVGAVAVVEGVRGMGADFMLGQAKPEALPSAVIREVEAMLRAASSELGPVRVEWVHDGKKVWVVQLHRGSTPSRGAVIYPGAPTVEHRFPVERGLEALRHLVQELQGTTEGIVLIGLVGVTSHFGDVLRAGRIPSRIESDSPTIDVPALFGSR
jgi:hypothetical protein